MQTEINVDIMEDQAPEAEPVPVYVLKSVLLEECGEERTQIRLNQNELQTLLTLKQNIQNLANLSNGGLTDATEAAEDIQVILRMMHVQRNPPPKKKVRRQTSKKKPAAK
jgi:hypothetical protein